ncbi:MAG: helix-turn-helix domain-containing protein [Deltaproteobacteria bacterium]|nr:helix-turn-helix domain-containing protein [Deltaproteobacteria bacterium]
MDGWGRIKQIAEYMSLSERAVRALLKQGLPHSRLNRKCILIKYSDVDEFISGFKSEENKVDNIVNKICNEMV